MDKNSLYNAIIKNINESFAINEDSFYYKKWAGKNYYICRNFFLKRGFKVIYSECEVHEPEGYGISILDSGASRVEIKTKLFRNQNTGHLNCGDVIEVKETIYD